MVIQFLDSHRISGLSSDTVETLTYNTDFSSSAGWTTTNASNFTVDTGNTQLDFSVEGGLSEGDRIYYDLGSVSNTSWVLRISKLNFSTINTYMNLAIALSDTTGTKISSQDGIGVWFSDGGDPNDYVYLMRADGGAFTSFSSSLSGQLSTSTDYYVEIIRNTETSITLNLYTGGFGGTLVTTSTQTIPSTIVGLRYLKIMETNPDVPTGVKGVGTIDEIKFYNGITSVTSKPKIAVGLNGCKAYYNFEQTTGNLTNIATTANGFADGLGSSADGTPTGVTQNDTGKLGSYAWNFDGSGDYVNVGTSTSQFNFLHNSSPTFTIAFWINPTAITNNSVIFDDGDVSSSNKGLAVRFESGNLLRVLLLASGTNTNVGTTGVFTTGGWQHVVITSNGGTTTIYRDNVSVGTGTLTGVSGDATYRPRIGWAANGNDVVLNAKLDDFAIWNRALTSTEISNLYNASSGRALNTQTNIETNSIFIETDTAKRWWYDGSNYQLQPTKQFDFSNSTGWVLDSGVAIQNGRLEITQGGVNTQLRGYYDLGSSQSTSFVLRFKVDTNNFTNNSSGQGISFQVMLSNQHTPSSYWPTNNNVMWSTSVHAATNESNFYSIINGWPNQTTGITRAEPLNIVRYVEMVANGGSLSCKIYTDSTYSTLEETITRSGTIPSDLRYLLIRVANENVSPTNTMYFDDFKFYNGVISVT